MQKKLIAAAVVGLFALPALAQTNVTISGNAKAGWESYRLSGGGNTGHDTESRVSDQSSGIRFNVVEDLGGGLKAWAQMDFRFGTDMGGLANSGNSGVGLMGDKWGKFTIGRWDVHHGELAGLEANRAGSIQTLFSSGIMSQVTSFNSAAAAAGTGGQKAANRTEVLAVAGNGTRTPNLLKWDSPVWDGFTATIGYATSGTGGATAEGSTNRGVSDPGGGRSWTTALRYNKAPWNAGVSYWNSTGEDRSVASGIRAHDIRGTRGWLGYTFAMGLKVGVAVDRSHLDNHLFGVAKGAGTGSTSRTNWMIPVSYSFGPHAIYGKYARAGSASGSAIAAGTGGNYKAHAWHIGYDYAFSKRTSAGVFYTKINNDSNAANTVGASYDLLAAPTASRRGEDARQWYFGMNHVF